MQLVTWHNNAKLTVVSRDNEECEYCPTDSVSDEVGACWKTHVLPVKMESFVWENWECHIPAYFFSC